MSEREELIKRNEEFVTLPRLDYKRMTDEQLKLRVEILEKTFKELFVQEGEDDCD